MNNTYLISESEFFTMTMVGLKVGCRMSLQICPGPGGIFPAKPPECGAKPSSEASVGHSGDSNDSDSRRG